jgi:hypothetical protein
VANAVAKVLLDLETAVGPHLPSPAVEFSLDIPLLDRRGARGMPLQVGAVATAVMVDRLDLLRAVAMEPHEPAAPTTSAVAALPLQAPLAVLLDNRAVAAGVLLGLFTGKCPSGA